MSETTQEKLRRHATTLRTNSLPLSALIPLLNEAADRIEAFEADAMRYRFLRDASWDCDSHPRVFNAIMAFVEDLDEAVDEAITNLKGE